MATMAAKFQKKSGENLKVCRIFWGEMKFPCLNVSSESVAAFLLPAWLPHFSPLDVTKVGKKEKIEGEQKFLESESEINTWLPVPVH